MQEMLDQLNKEIGPRRQTHNAAERDRALASAFSAGAGSVVACENGPRPPSETAQILGQGDVWTIYGPKP